MLSPDFRFRDLVSKKGQLDWSPKKNWVDRAGGLPPYIEQIAVDLVKDRGMDRSRAIAIAVGMCRRWMVSGKPDTKAKAAKAIAQWEKMKASTHAKGAMKAAKKMG